MAVTKTIDVDGKPVTFRASAAIPRLYRNKFHRDIYRDLNELQKGIDDSDAENSSLDTFSLELFENIAWLMAKHADKTVPDSLCHLEGQHLEDYLHDVKICQEFAVRNREIMTGLILKKTGMVGLESFHTVHNYIDTDEMILRKGAIAAGSAPILATMRRRPI